MYRKEMLSSIGGFDEDLFAYGDDAELGLRARIAGWRCLYTPHAVVRHHRGATLGKQSGRRLQLIERNRVLLAAKLFPWSLLWRNGGYYLARLAAGVWASAQNKGDTVLYPGWKGRWTMAMSLLMGDLDAIRLLPLTLRKRRRIESIRKLTPRQVKELILRHQITLKELSQGPPE
jgi:GT2 family glycosyltransferase